MWRLPPDARQQVLSTLLDTAEYESTREAAFFPRPRVPVVGEPLQVPQQDLKQEKRLIRLRWNSDSSAIRYRSRSTITQHTNLRVGVGFMQSIPLLWLHAAVLLRPQLIFEHQNAQLSLLGRDRRPHARPPGFCFWIQIQGWRVQS